MPRQQLYLPLDLHDCPIEPRYFRDTRTTCMNVTNDDGSTSETLIHDSWRCLSDASDSRQEKEWMGYTEFQISSRYLKENDKIDSQSSSTFSLAVIQKPLETGKESVDIFDDVEIRNERCKTDKRMSLRLTGGGYKLTDGQLDLLFCEEDQDNDSIGKIDVTLISADERKPRLVLVCSEEINWFIHVLRR